jgi:hypothetical protein
MRRLLRILTALILATAALPAAGTPPSFTVGWSVYVGWNPYQYMARSGILRKWADKFGVSIKVQRFDYAPSLDAFVAKNIDACTMTNMEALDMPAAAGVDTTTVIIGDYSNGNDAVLVRHNLKLAQMPGKRVLLVEKTVSQYLFERAMTLNNQVGELKRVKYGIGGVENGTGRRLHGGLKLPDGTMVPVGGKTGTGDNEFRIHGAQGGLLGSRVVNRTAGFAFFIGNRFFGTILAFVPGKEAANYKFTSALAVQVLKI